MTTPTTPNSHSDDRMKRIERKAKIDQWEREKLKADIEFSQQPWWIRAADEGDYARDGSDLQPWDDEQLKEEE